MPPSATTASVLETWTRGVGLLREGDLVRASDCFEFVLDYDPSIADAWLGLYATGERRDEALRGMIRHQVRLGQFRDITGLDIRTSFAIGKFVAYKLNGAYDAWLAHVAALLDADDFAAAGDQLSLAADRETTDQTRFLQTRLHYEQEQWEQVLKAAHGITDRALHDEATLYVAASLVHLGTPYEALEVLKGLPTEVSAPAYIAHLAFVRGVAMESLGEEREAAQSFQRAFRLAPEVEAFAERVRALRPKKAVDLDFDRRTPTGGADRAALLSRAAATLDAMIGLDSVKQQIEALKAQYRMAVLKKERGLPSAVRPQHFVFTGPPGTGKTTVARVMGEILAGLGLLEHGRVVEAQRGDLVGGFLGHTAMKTRAKIDEATGGVLFIDEAYSLANRGYAEQADAFGDEALQEILTAAENRRDRLVIVLAGYTDQIDGLLDTNPGLRSRFSTVVEFPQYTARELTEIAFAIFDGAGEALTGDAEDALREGFAAAVDGGGIDELGNGRFARELSHRATGERDLRLLRLHGDHGTPSSAEMTTVEAVDVAGAFARFAR
ncbi:AAA family ATPase [Glycomyces sp. NPDC047010]|uniref:AAA family ATPase n=1 Tax=Glycomyces sp. NPDC047010 TaxID=3155023 RepID=UPI0033E01129